MENLSEINTKDLVEELKKRTGVIATIEVPPNEKVRITSEGPSTVLIVID